MQQKTYIKCFVVVRLWLFFKVLFTWKCIKKIYFIFKKLFLISTHQHKKILIWSKKIIKYFLKYFLNIKNNSVLQTNTPVLSSQGRCVTMTFPEHIQANILKYTCEFRMDNILFVFGLNRQVNKTKQKNWMFWCLILWITFFSFQDTWYVL
jgi:hypothetical protein